MNFPTEQQCLELFKRFKVPQNIKEHCLKVREIAVFLAKKLQKEGEQINLELVDKTALLHDLFKIVAINPEKETRFHSNDFTEEQLIIRRDLIKQYPHMKEHQIAHRFFKQDYPELANILLYSSDLQKNKDHWEELLICYADSRAFKNKIVSQTERFAYLEEHYFQSDELWEFQKRKLEEIENKIFSKINIKPEQLAEEIDGQRLL